MASARTGAGRLAAWSCFLALTLRLLHGAAFAQLSIPLGSLDQLADWADHTSPMVMALAVVRLGALVAAWYLTVATVLAVVADVAGWRRLAAVVAALSPSLVRRLASRSAGVGLAAAGLAAVSVLITSRATPHFYRAAIQQQGPEAGEQPMMLDGRESRLVMEEITDPTELARAQAQWERFDRNWAWFEAHAAEIYKAHRGKCVCVAGQELFVADTPEEVLARAATAHPEDDGRFTRYIPRERIARIIEVK